MSGSVTGRGPVTGYDPPVQSYNGDYIPSLSSQLGSLFITLLKCYVMEDYVVMLRNKYCLIGN